MSQKDLKEGYTHTQIFQCGVTATWFSWIRSSKSLVPLVFSDPFEKTEAPGMTNRPGVQVFSQRRRSHKPAEEAKESVVTAILK